jgi:integrase
VNGHTRKRHKPECAHRSSRGQKRCNCDGSWQARYPDPSGKAGAEISKTFRTEREAKLWLVQQTASQLDGTFIDPRRAERPFRDVLEAWRPSWPARLSPTTAARYASIVDLYLEPRFGSVPLRNITHEVVQTYIDELANALNEDGTRTNAPGTVRNIYSVLRNAMNQGVRRGYVKANPCTAIDLPRSAKEEQLYLTAAQVQALADRIDKHYRVLILTAAYMGLRAGELLALRRRDVDLLRGTLTVARSLKEVGGHQTFSEPKTSHSVRTISIPAFLREMLTEHLSSPLPGGDGPDALVFPSKTGKPLRHNLFYRRHFKPAVTGYVKADGTVVPGALPAHLHGLRFHDLRHTCASLSIAAGAHPKLISTRLGHSSITITLDRYGHLYESAEQSLGEALDALYAAAQTPPEPSNVTELRPAEEA